MDKQYNVIDALLDENNFDPITLYSSSDESDNEEYKLEQIAIIPYDGKIYAILKPLFECDWLEEDEAMVFLVDIEQNEIFEVEDEEIIDGVFEIYYEAFKEEE